jgi:hypothetical protein
LLFSSNSPASIPANSPDQLKPAHHAQQEKDNFADGL